MKQISNCQKPVPSGKGLLSYLFENDFLKQRLFEQMSENVVKQGGKEDAWRDGEPNNTMTVLFRL